MELLALNCQHCSAPLQVPAEAKFVTCTHCGSQLAVRRTGSVAYTETLEAIDTRTERMAEQLDDLHRRSSLADLDNRWETERERFYMTGKNGHRYLPTTGGSVAGGAAIAVFGVIWTMIACGIGGAFQHAPGPFGLVGMVFPLFGVAFIGFGLWNAYEGYRKADEYERARRQYQRERATVVADEGSPRADDPRPSDATP